MNEKIKKILNKDTLIVLLLILNIVFVGIHYFKDYNVARNEGAFLMQQQIVGQVINDLQTKGFTTLTIKDNVYKLVLDTKEEVSKNGN